MEQVFFHAREIPLTINRVQQLHRDLLQFSGFFSIIAGILN